MIPTAVARDDSRSWYQKVSAIAIDPTDDDTWYVGAGAYARSFQQVGWQSLPDATAENPRGRDEYSGDEHQGRIWRTEDGGQTWATLSSGIHPDAQFSRIIRPP